MCSCCKCPAEVTDTPNMGASCMLTASPCAPSTASRLLIRARPLPSSVSFGNAACQSPRNISICMHKCENIYIYIFITQSSDFVGKNILYGQIRRWSVCGALYMKRTATALCDCASVSRGCLLLTTMQEKTSHVSQPYNYQQAHAERLLKQ